jgi:hypothetical protein
METARGNQPGSSNMYGPLADFLDLARISFPQPPSLATPANPLPGLVAYQAQPILPAPASTVPSRS